MTSLLGKKDFIVEITGRIS